MKIRRQFRFSPGYKPSIGTRSNSRVSQKSNEGEERETFLRIQRRKPPTLDVSRILVKMLPWGIAAGIVFYFIQDYFLG